MALQSENLDDNLYFDVVGLMLHNLNVTCLPFNIILPVSVAVSGEVAKDDFDAVKVVVVVIFDAVVKDFGVDVVVSMAVLVTLGVVEVVDGDLEVCDVAKVGTDSEVSKY